MGSGGRNWTWGARLRGKGWQRRVRATDLGGCGGLEHGVWEVSELEHLSRECAHSGCGGWAQR